MHASLVVADRKRVVCGRERGRPGGWQAQRRDSGEAVLLLLPRLLQLLGRISFSCRAYSSSSRLEASLLVLPRLLQLFGRSECEEVIDLHFLGLIDHAGTR